jgi:hypothetical protein
MAKYSIFGEVRAGKYLGEVEADSEEEAIDKAYIELMDEMDVSLCHQCADEAEDASIDEISASKIE